MRLEALPQIVGIGFGQFAAFSAGLGRNHRQFLFAARQNSPVTFLQVGQFDCRQFLVRAIETLMQVFRNKRFMCLAHR